jgi:hypothetical protein
MGLRKFFAELTGTTRAQGFQTASPCRLALAAKIPDNPGNPHRCRVSILNLQATRQQ